MLRVDVVHYIGSDGAATGERIVGEHAVVGVVVKEVVGAVVLLAVAGVEQRRVRYNIVAGSVVSTQEGS